PLSADPFERAAVGQVAVGATEVELSELAQAQLLAALVGGLRRRALDVDFDGSAVGDVSQIDREGEVFLALHQPLLAGGRLAVAGGELLDAEHPFGGRLPSPPRRPPCP